jgi:hypothetical protein
MATTNTKGMMITKTTKTTMTKTAKTMEVTLSMGKPENIQQSLKTRLVDSRSSNESDFLLGGRIIPSHEERLVWNLAVAACGNRLGVALHPWYISKFF